MRWVGSVGGVACHNEQRFQGAGWRSQRYLHFNSSPNERNRNIELIHPEGRVVGIMSPVFHFFVLPRMLNVFKPYRIVKKIGSFVPINDLMPTVTSNPRNQMAQLWYVVTGET